MATLNEILHFPVFHFKCDYTDCRAVFHDPRLLKIHKKTLHQDLNETDENKERTRKFYLFWNTRQAKVDELISATFPTVRSVGRFVFNRLCNNELGTSVQSSYFQTEDGCNPSPLAKTARENNDDEFIFSDNSEESSAFNAKREGAASFNGTANDRVKFCLGPKRLTIKLDRCKISDYDGNLEKSSKTSKKYGSIPRPYYPTSSYFYREKRRNDGLIKRITLLEKLRRVKTQLVNFHRKRGHALRPPSSPTSKHSPSKKKKVAIIERRINTLSKQRKSLMLEISILSRFIRSPLTVSSLPSYPRRLPMERWISPEPFVIYDVGPKALAMLTFARAERELCGPAKREDVLYYKNRPPVKSSLQRKIVRTGNPISLDPELFSVGSDSEDESQRRWPNIVDEKTEKRLGDGERDIKKNTLEPKEREEKPQGTLHQLPYVTDKNRLEIQRPKTQNEEKQKPRQPKTHQSNNHQKEKKLEKSRKKGRQQTTAVHERLSKKTLISSESRSVELEYWRKKDEALMAEQRLEAEKRRMEEKRWRERNVSLNGTSSHQEPTISFALSQCCGSQAEKGESKKSSQISVPQRDVNGKARKLSLLNEGSSVEIVQDIPSRVNKNSRAIALVSENESNLNQLPAFIKLETDLGVPSAVPGTMALVPTQLVDRLPKESRRSDEVRSPEEEDPGDMIMCCYLCDGVDGEEGYPFVGGKMDDYRRHIFDHLVDADECPYCNEEKDVFVSEDHRQKAIHYCENHQFIPVVRCPLCQNTFLYRKELEGHRC